MTVENISWSNLHERMLLTRWGSTPQPPDHQSDGYLSEPPRLAAHLGVQKIVTGKAKYISRYASISGNQKVVSANLGRQRYVLCPLHQSMFLPEEGWWGLNSKNILDLGNLRSLKNRGRILDTWALEVLQENKWKIWSPLTGFLTQKL